MTIWPWQISGLHPERTGANTMDFHPFEVAIGNANPSDSIRFTSVVHNVLNVLGPNGRDAGAWPAVVSGANTRWNFYACKDEISGLNPMILASQSVAYSASMFADPSLSLYGPGNCRKLPFGAIYDVGIGWMPMVYNRDGSVIFTGFEFSARYKIISLTCNGTWQVVDCSKLMPDAARNALLHFDPVSGGSGSICVKPGSGVAGSAGFKVAKAGSGVSSAHWVVTNSYWEIQVNGPAGAVLDIYLQGYRDSELS